MGFLTEAVERVRREFARNPPGDDGLLDRARALPPARDFVGALRAPGIGVIAEVKRASPSAGEIADAETVWDPGTRVERYERGGAVAVSVLTEAAHFGGSMADLKLARRHTALPILRKDFIVHPAQVVEARAAGADAVLLIAAGLSAGEIADLRDVAEDLGMATLVETHAPGEIDLALGAGATVIGVNARNLETLEVDLDGALATLATFASGDRVFVLESGIASREDVLRAESAGACAVLVGEALMRAADPAAKVRELVGV